MLGQTQELQIQITKHVQLANSMIIFHITWQPVWRSKQEALATLIQIGIDQEHTWDTINILATQLPYLLFLLRQHVSFKFSRSCPDANGS